MSVTADCCEHLCITYIYTLCIPVLYIYIMYIYQRAGQGANLLERKYWMKITSELSPFNSIDIVVHHATNVCWTIRNGQAHVALCSS